VLGAIGADAIVKSSSNCKTRSGSTPVCPHARPRFVALEHGLGKPL